MASQQLRNHGHHIDRRLRFRLRLYFFIALILLIILLFNIFRGALSIEFGTLGFIIGIGVGIITSRMFHTSWDKDAKKVISRFDLYGVIILVLYIAFEVFRSTIVTYFTHDIQVSTTGFAVLAGVMFGRVIGTRGRIIEVLKEQKVFGI